MPVGCCFVGEVDAVFVFSTAAAAALFITFLFRKGLTKGCPEEEEEEEELLL